MKIMERKEILESLNEIFKDVLDLDEVDLKEETTAYDIEEWDSLNHIQLVDAIQKKMNVKFTSKEIATWMNVGEMIDSIISKL